MSAGDQSGSGEPSVPSASLEGQVMPPAKIPAAEICNGAQAASKLDTASPCGRRPAHLPQTDMPASLAWTGPVSAGGNQQGAIACRDGHEAAQAAFNSRNASPALANPLQAFAQRERGSEQLLYLPSQLSSHEAAPTAAACQSEFHSSSAVTTERPALSTASLSSESSLQNASQALEAAMASGSVQQLAAGINAAVRALSVVSGAASEQTQVTKVCLPGSLSSSWQTQSWPETLFAYQSH